MAAEPVAANTREREAPCGCKWYADGTTYKCLSHRRFDGDPRAERIEPSAANTPRYADLNEHAQRIVDERATRMAATLRITLDEAREVIARRVVTKTHRPSHGTSH